MAQPLVKVKFNDISRKLMKSIMNDSNHQYVCPTLEFHIFENADSDKINVMDSTNG